jgi:glycerol-3-phosphate acyltransferase PlsY
VLRTGNKYAALLTLLADALKAYLPLLIISPTNPLVYIIPVLGHVFPVWLKFKGGKGVATALGALLAFDPLLAVLGGGLWGLTVFLTRYVSLGSLVAVIVLPVVDFVLHDFRHSFWLFCLAALTAYTHRENIQRLRTGTENHIGDSKKRNRSK